MDFNLKVLNPKIKEQSMGDKIRQHKPIINHDDRWNDEITISINEKLVLDIIDQITDRMVENNYFLRASRNRLKISHAMYPEIDKLIRSTMVWKTIQTKIINQGYQTSIFTRISLFEQLINLEKIKKSIEEKIIEKTNIGGGNWESEKPKEKLETEIAPIAPIKTVEKIAKDNMSEFMKNLKF